MEEYIIKVENLSKKFGKKTILNNVNIKFKKGESVAILGNNGMGKSTFIRMICGLTSITSGKVIFDKDITFNYIPENYSKLNLTIEEYLNCMGDLDKVSKKSLDVKIKELYNEFFLENLKDVPMKNLSKGSLQKVAIIQALLKKSNVLLLDEPLTGLDINSQKNFICIVKELISQGVTVIMSCHELHLVEELSSRVLEIKNQTIVESENPKVEKVVYNLMIFEKKEKSSINIVSEIKNIGEYYEENGLLKLKVRVSNSNDILLRMLHDGYILKYFK